MVTGSLDRANLPKAAMIRYCTLMVGLILVPIFGIGYTLSPQAPDSIGEYRRTSSNEPTPVVETRAHALAQTLARPFLGDELRLCDLIDPTGAAGRHPGPDMNPMMDYVTNRRYFSDFVAW